MSAAETLKTLSGRIRSRAIVSKAEVRQGVILALLHELGWPVFDTNVVRPSHGINGDSVDFGLLGDQGELVAVIIADAPSELDVDAVDPSLYVSDSDKPLVIHTNGLAWRFMLSLPPKGISCDKALVVSIDGNSTAERLGLLLRRENLIAGHAHAELARLLAHKPTEMAVLMAAWCSLAGTEDQLLPTLLADKVEARTGSRPSVEEVTAFFRVPEPPATDQDTTDAGATINVFPPPVAPPILPELKLGGSDIKRADEGQRLSQRDRMPGCWYRIGDSRVSVTNGKAVVLGILRHLEAQLPGFLARCVAHPDNAGSSRRYIGRTPSELYPERPDYAADPGKYAQIVPGWLLMTNFSADVKIRIIDLAASVAGLTQGQDIAYNLDR